jgi:hypothetical protein
LEVFNNLRKKIAPYVALAIWIMILALGWVLVIYIDKSYRFLATVGMAVDGVLSCLTIIVAVAAVFGNVPQPGSSEESQEDNT